MSSLIDPVNDAAFRTVHDHGGVQLAARMGLKPRLLLNKVNPDQHHNKLSLGEAVWLQHLTGDPRILYAMARMLGYLVIRIEHSFSTSDVELLTLYAQWQDQTGQIHHAIASALEDQTITPAEQATIEQRFHAAECAGLTYLRRMEGLVQ